MHPNVPVALRGSLARAPQPHGRAGVVRAFVEDLPNSDSDVDTTEWSDQGKNTVMRARCRQERGSSKLTMETKS